MHSHTSLSDGTGTPDDAFQSARNADLDFFAVTEHNHSRAAGDDGVFLTPSGYETLKQSAIDHTQDGVFVAIHGQEVSTISKGNHVNVFNSDNIVDIENGDFRDLYERYLRDHTEVPFIQFNHADVRKDRNPQTPSRKRNNDYGIGQYNQDFRQLVAAADNHVSLMELIIGPAFSPATNFAHHNGKHEHDYLFYLNEGFRIAPSAGQDNHEPNWGFSTEARMGVWATALTKEAIFKALRDRRTFASEDRNISVSFRAGETWMGDTVEITPDSQLDFQFSILDPDEPGARYKVKVFEDAAIGGDLPRVVDIIEVNGNTNNFQFSRNPDVGSYYFLKITQSSTSEGDRDDIWTAPIWVAPAIDDDPGIDHKKSNLIDWNEAHDFVGQDVAVEGQIVDSFLSDRVLFLNFGTNFRDTLTLVVFADDFTAFGDMEDLEQDIVGNKVRANGKISVYRDRVQMILNSPDQLQMIP